MNEKSIRTRNKNNILALAYDIKYPNLKVIHKCRSYLATMGVPANNGEHYLWPEEAVYLLEIGSAIIYCNARPLTLLEGYRILHEKKVSHFKYLIYVSLKRGGFVVIRPKRKNVSLKLSDTEKKDDAITEKDERARLLDSFPSLSEKGLHIPFLNSCEKYIPFSADFKMPDMSVLGISRDANRLAPCRTNYIPKSRKLTAAKSWAEFRALQEELKVSKRCRRIISSKPTLISDDNIDFEIYPPTYSFHSSQEPLHRVVCFDVINGEIDVHKLCSNYKNAAVIVAIHQHGKINFIKSSGEEIKLLSRYPHQHGYIGDVDMIEV